MEGLHDKAAAPGTRDGSRKFSFRRVVLLVIVTALLAAIAPAGVLLDRRLADALENRARVELSMVPTLVADRNRSVADAIMMHAKDIAAARGLAEAVAAGDRERAFQLAEQARGSFGDAVLLVDAIGLPWIDSLRVDHLVEATRRGESPVALVEGAEPPQLIGLAPIFADDEWRGAAGVAVAIDDDMAGTLSALTLSDVVILDGNGRVVATTAEPDVTSRVVGEAPIVPSTSWTNTDVASAEVIRVDAGGHRLLVAGTGLESATLLFIRDLDRELDVLPDLRRVAGLAAMGMLVLAGIFGWLFAAALARPVQRLAGAARELARGDFETRFESSQVVELDELSTSFDRMRRALAARLADLLEANRELEDRQLRLAELQSELIQRERTSATGWLVAQLAHEIRNPIASVRNNLEVLRRRVESDPEVRDFADMAIDELLRMHELSERILDLNRPGDPGAESCDVTAVANDVSALSTLAMAPDALQVDVRGAGQAAIPANVLKQVLLHLVQNAHEAREQGLEVSISIESADGLVRIDVADNGPGIAPALSRKIFDPFFTTKGVAGGSGLGLYTADGFVRRYGGRIRAVESAAGARFRIELPSTGSSPHGAVAPAHAPDPGADGAAGPSRLEVEP